MGLLANASGEHAHIPLKAGWSGGNVVIVRWIRRLANTSRFIEGFIRASTPAEDSGGPRAQLRSLSGTRYGVTLANAGGASSSGSGAETYVVGVWSPVIVIFEATSYGITQAHTIVDGVLEEDLLSSGQGVTEVDTYRIGSSGTSHSNAVWAHWALFDLGTGMLTSDQLAELQTKLPSAITGATPVIGSRKVVVEDDRFYTAGHVLMTGAVNNAVGQATTFTANGSRVGTSLNADGSVGVTKGVNTFKPSAPGMMLNDNRIVVGELRNSRFRMARPFAMGELHEARNSNGLFTGKKEGYGEQFIVSHTPVNRKGAATSIILYSSTGRVARAA